MRTVDSRIRVRDSWTVIPPSPIFAPKLEVPPKLPSCARIDSDDGAMLYF